MKRSSRKKTAAEFTPDEVDHLEQISRRYEESEKAWLNMTSPPEEDEPWTKTEDYFLARPPQDQERRWKFFSK